MGTSLALVPRSELAAYAATAGERRIPRVRRAALLSVANIVAIGLAFGALHVLSSAVVTEAEGTPPSQAVANEAPAVPLPTVRARMAGIADEATMFAAPVFAGTEFEPITPAAFADRFVTRTTAQPAPPRVEEDPVAEAPPPIPRSFVPPSVAKLASIAGVGRDAGQQVAALADGVSVDAAIDPQRGKIRAGVALNRASVTVDSGRLTSATAATVASAVNTTTSTVGSALSGVSGLLD